MKHFVTDTANLSTLQIEGIGEVSLDSMQRGMFLVPYKITCVHHYSFFLRKENAGSERLRTAY